MCCSLETAIVIFEVKELSLELDQGSYDVAKLASILRGQMRQRT